MSSSRIACVGCSLTGPIRFLCVVLLAVAASACGSSPVATPSPKTRVVRYLFPGRNDAFSNGLLERIHTTMPDMHVENVPSTGSIVVLSALQKGEADFGYSLADVAYIAYRKGLEGDQYPHSDLRGMAVRWMSTMYVLIPRQSNVRRMSDLSGKRIGVVPLGSAGALLTRMLLEAHGVAFENVHPVFMGMERFGKQIHDGAIDAALMPATPLNDIHKLLVDYDLRVVELDRSVVRRLQAEYLFVKSVSLTTGLVGTAGPLTVGVDSIVVCRADLDEQVVYDLTRVFYGILTNMAGMHAGIDPENASAVPIPLHPGAARFYREQQILNES